VRTKRFSPRHPWPQVSRPQPEIESNRVVSPSNLARSPEEDSIEMHLVKGSMKAAENNFGKGSPNEMLLNVSAVESPAVDQLIVRNFTVSLQFRKLPREAEINFRYIGTRTA
jgi:hypothetical protein